jgi:large subunit ribosomal protein L29
MAILRVKEIRELSEKNLKKKNEELVKELLKTKAQSASKVNPENPGRIKEIKKTIARINTIKKERGIK